MIGNPKYLEVAVAAPIYQTLTYAAPDGPAEPRPGMRLLVPLGARSVTGYLLGFTNTPPESGKVKKIIDVLDTEPLFPVDMVPFYRWIAEYYHYPIGEVIRSALPGGLAPQSGREVHLTEEGRTQLSALASEQIWLAQLLDKGSLSPATCRRLWRGRDRRLLEKWQKEGLVEIRSVVSGQTIRARTETCVCLVEASEPPNDLKKSEEKTLDLIRDLTSRFHGLVPRRELALVYSSARTAIKSLTERGLVTLVEQEVYRDPFGEPALEFDTPAQLTIDQKQVLTRIVPALESGEFAPFLLHGVTGSGKTEIYLRAADKALKQGKNVLLMVPEIALATQLEGHFISRFGNEVALIHSGLSAGEKFDQWMRLARGTSRIVIGARSAVFAPLASLGLIIVDEEHDPAYKQEDGLRYQGRDLAVLRASQEKAVVILGSATPSITSYFHTTTGKYQLLSMPSRIEERPMPIVEVIDLKKIPTVSGRPPLFSPDLIKAIGDKLAKGEQSLIFLNRRGYANLMICQDCGRPVQCTSCNISLTLHQKRGALICHYCGYQVKSATICANCQSARLLPIGFGTERIEDELAARFPTARIARLDHDTTTDRAEFLKILRSVHRHEIDILVGTQMITKGHHFPQVTLVGVVWADAGLGMPDYKAGERTFQLLSQVTGRAGRGDKEGMVIVQTYYPDHYSITNARAHDYVSLYNQELELRKALTYPPFSRLANIRLEGEDEKEVGRVAADLARDLKIEGDRCKVDILGPAASPLARIRGRYRWQILLKGSDTQALHAVCAWALTAGQGSRMGGVKLTVDVDPENML